MVKDMNQKTFGIDLCKAREDRGMGGTDLAEKLGVSANSVHKWENGLSFPRPDKWKAIEFETGIKPQEYRLKKTADATQDAQLPATFKDGFGRDIEYSEAERMLQEIMKHPGLNRVAIVASLKALFKANLLEEEMEGVKIEVVGLRREVREILGFRQEFREMMKVFMEQFGGAGSAKREIPATGQ